jgi:hypothetical protein
MKNIWLRRLIPAFVVSLVLAFSYVMPAVGLIIPPVIQSHPGDCGGHGIHDNKHGYGYGCPGPQPVKSPSPTRCNEFGDGHHGAKDSVLCPSPTPPGPPPAVRLAPPFKDPSLRGQGTGLSTPTTKPVIDSSVSDSVSRWRAFIDLVLHEVS